MCALVGWPKDTLEVMNSPRASSSITDSWIVRDGLKRTRRSRMPSLGENSTRGQEIVCIGLFILVDTHPQEMLSVSGEQMIKLRFVGLESNLVKLTNFCQIMRWFWTTSRWYEEIRTKSRHWSAASYLICRNGTNGVSRREFAMILLRRGFKEDCGDSGLLETMSRNI